MHLLYRLRRKWSINKKKERLCDKAYDLMLIWKQRIGDDVDENLKNEDPKKRGLCGSTYFYALRKIAISMHQFR